MKRKIGIQLYSLREYAARDFIGELKWVAGIGYKCVEIAGFWNIRPTALRKIVEDLGMTICSSHSPWANTGNLGEAMDIADSLGLRTIIYGGGPEDFKDLDTIKAMAERTNTITDILKRNGFKLMQHNHYWEFDRLDGRLKYEIYADLCPDVRFQLDTFWATNHAVEDAVAMVKQFAPRIISAHLKDGTYAPSDGADSTLDSRMKMLPLGDGFMPLFAVIDALPDTIDHVIVELDRCDSMEMHAAVANSYRYLTENGLAG